VTQNNATDQQEQERRNHGTETGKVICIQAHKL
jgi:hypothetical protein